MLSLTPTAQQVGAVAIIPGGVAGGCTRNWILSSHLMHPSWAEFHPHARIGDGCERDAPRGPLAGPTLEDADMSYRQGTWPNRRCDRMLIYVTTIVGTMMLALPAPAWWSPSAVVGPDTDSALCNLAIQQYSTFLADYALHGRSAPPSDVPILANSSTSYTPFHLSFKGGAAVTTTPRSASRLGQSCRSLRPTHNPDGLRKDRRPVAMMPFAACS